MGQRPERVHVGLRFDRARRAAARRSSATAQARRKFATARAAPTEGSLLLIDATTAPYVHKYQSVEKFLQSPYQETRDVDIAASSALGSAALAWDISVALEKPVLAIVPGYGVDWVTRKATLPGYPPSNSKS